MAVNRKNEKKILEEEDSNSGKFVNGFDGKERLAPNNIDEMTSVEHAPEAETIPNEKAFPTDVTNKSQDDGDSAPRNGHIEAVKSIKYDTRGSQADDIPSGDVTIPYDKFPGDDDINSRETGDSPSGSVNREDGNGTKSQHSGDVSLGDDSMLGDDECSTDSGTESEVFKDDTVPLSTETFPSGTVCLMRETLHILGSMHIQGEGNPPTAMPIALPHAVKTEIYPPGSVVEKIRNGHKNHQGDEPSQISHAQPNKPFGDDSGDRDELEVDEVNREPDEDYDYDDTYFDELFDDEDLSVYDEDSHGSDLPLALGTEDLEHHHIFEPRPHSPSNDRRGTEPQLPGAEIEPSDLPPTDFAPRLKRPRPGSRYRVGAVLNPQAKAQPESSITMSPDHVIGIDSVDMTRVQTAQGDVIGQTATAFAWTVETPSNSTREEIARTSVVLQQGRAMEVDIDSCCCSDAPQLRREKDCSLSNANVKAVESCSESVITSDMAGHRNGNTKSKQRKKGRLRRGLNHFREDLRRFGRRVVSLATCCCRST